MSTDPDSPYADPADITEAEDAAPPGDDDDEAPARDPDGLPLEADEADVAEQRTEVPDWEDDGDET